MGSSHLWSSAFNLLDLFLGESEARGGGDLFDLLRVPGADNGRGHCRMMQYPPHGHFAGRTAMPRPDRLESVHALEVLR